MNNNIFKSRGKDDYSVIDKVEIKMEQKRVLGIIEKFTEVHREYSDKSKEEREVECLSVLFPNIMNDVCEDDYILGKVDILPIGFGSVTTVGGVGYYAQVDNLKKLRDGLTSENDKKRVEELLKYWSVNDSREKFFKDSLIENVLGRFVEIEYPAIVTARLSGMYLDYNKLCNLGIKGLREEINSYKNKNTDEAKFYKSLDGVLNIYQRVIDFFLESIETNIKCKDKKWSTMISSLKNIREDKPSTFIEAMQLTWIFSVLSGVVNYGRMDDYLGEYLVNDLDNGAITWEEALEYTKSLFKVMAEKRTLANSRVIIGGRGRVNENTADVFCKLAIEAIRENKEIEPQLTLRIFEGMNKEIYNLALEAIGDGLTFPILYNDDVNIKAVMNAMSICEDDAKQYVPLGCGEINISTQGVSTPNTCMNLLKILSISLNEGIDPFDKLDKSAGNKYLPAKELKTFEDVFDQYKKALDYFCSITAKGQAQSYEFLNNECSFLVTSLLTNNCIQKGKAVLDGGVKYLGGTNETYGNISTCDSLTAIKKVVFEDEKCTMEELVQAINCNFEGYEELRKELLAAPKYGNDDDYADDIAKELHEYVCNKIRNSAKEVGLDYFLVVMINNQIGTQWGTNTAASANGRRRGDYMSNGNNPQSGNDKNGPTAMLNSLNKLTPCIHGGAVQNMKFSKELFNNNREIAKSLLDVYFKDGGAQIMVTVVGREELEDAYLNPEKYPNLVVRVGGFSARFIDLNKNVQREILNRTLN